jgi:hypothetical protein
LNASPSKLASTIFPS